MKNSEIRLAARKNLQHSIFGEAWMMALLVALVYSIISSASGALYGVVLVVIGGSIEVGLALTFLNVARSGEKAKIDNLFSGFGEKFGDNLILGLVSTIFISLWSLLLIVPGIIKKYSYSMIYYIRNDEPELDFTATMNKSIAMMKGNKAKLFCLDLSFIGWYLLGILCFGIGVLWVAPYHHAARANFYLDLKNNA